MTTDEFADLIFKKDKREEFINMAQELLGGVRDGGKKNNANNNPETDDVKKENAIDDIMASFGYCPCGRPEVFLSYLRNYLRLVEAKDYAASEDVWAPYWYFCDEKGFTEHGGSVLGAWLTDKGKEMLEKLNEVEL